MKIINLKIILVISTVIFLNSKTQGQELPSKNAASAIKSIATDLNVSDNRAKQIWSILNYNHSAIEQVIKDRGMDAEKRHKSIKKLLEERAIQINASLTTAEKELLKQHQAPALQHQWEKMLDRTNKKSLENNTKALKGGTLKQAGKRMTSTDSTQNTH